MAEKKTDKRNAKSVGKQFLSEGKLGHISSSADETQYSSTQGSHGHHPG